MLERELLGATVEVGPASAEIAAPLLERPVAGGEGVLLASRERALLRIDGVAAIEVSDGQRIVVEPAAGAETDSIIAWLHGTAAALLLAQQGRFALHASVVAVGGSAVAIAGPIGSGKSTTALQLAAAGHQLITDDVSALDLNAAVAVIPFDRDLHVWPETAEALGMDLSGARSVRAGARKLALPPPQGKAVQLDAIAVLRVEACDGVAAEQARGAKALRLVAANVYRGRLLGPLWRDELFEWAGSVAARATVHELARPEGVWSVEEVAATVERIASDLPAEAGL